MADFLTVPDKLIEIAEAAERHFKSKGFSVRREKQDLSYPATPALYCVRRPTTLFVDVASKFEERRLSSWGSFAQSMSSDTQVALVTPERSQLLARVSWFSQNKIGLYEFKSGVISEIIPPQDLAFQVSLPNLAHAKSATRKSLGPAFDQILRGHWREGFESACQALEALSRRHLIDGLKGPRLQFRDKTGKTVTVTKARVEKATLGAVGTLLTQASPMNAKDAVLQKAILRINAARIDVAHKKYAREATLRKNVGALIWIIYNAIEEVC